MRDSKLEVLEKLHSLIAPNIIGLSEVKKILLLQLYSNPRENLGKINILMVGEVGTAKSVLAKAELDIWRKGVYMGQKTTVPGFISASEDADGGLVICDEFDKWEKKLRMSMLELMQFSETTVTHAGNQFKVISRSNVIACCNPSNYKLVRGRSLISQTPFTLDTLSRFHLLLPFWAVNPKSYRPIARAMVTEYPEELISQIEDLKDNIQDAREGFPSVSVSAELADALGGYIQRLTDVSRESDMITPRMIEGAIGLLKARARLRGSSVANETDYDHVKRILENIYEKGIV